MKSFYVYILKCNDGTFYTGFTVNIEQRLAQHKLGKGAKYTRSRLPVDLVYFEMLETKSEALKREYQLRRLSHREKERLSSNNN